MNQTRERTEGRKNERKRLFIIEKSFICGWRRISFAPAFEMSEMKHAYIDER